MRWALGILGGYVALLVATIVAYPYIAHAARYRLYEVTDGRGHYLTVEKDLPLPFLPRVTTATVTGRYGDVLDEEVYRDTGSLVVDRWDLDSVTLRYARTGTNDGVTFYRSVLKLEQ